MDSTRKDQLVEAFLAYGLNEYEARAYLALLQHGPAVAGEISRRSGIPRPRVYDTLQRLIDAALVTENGGSPRSYAPLPLDDFLNQMTSQFRRRQDLLRGQLAAIRSENRHEGIFHVHDEAPIQRLAEDLIDRAQSHLLLRASGVDLGHWSRALEGAVDRGVRVEGQVFGPAELPPGTTLRERPAGENRSPKGGRRLVICIDGEEILVGEIGSSERPYAARTRNRVLVECLGESAGSREPVAGATPPLVNANRS